MYAAITYLPLDLLQPSRYRVIDERSYTVSVRSFNLPGNEVNVSNLVLASYQLLSDSYSRQAPLLPLIARE